VYRRNQSRQARGCSGLIMGLIFMAIGGGLFFYFSSSYFNSLHFPTARCTILARSIVTDSSSDGDSYTPQFTLSVQPTNGLKKYQTQSNYNLTQGSTSDYGQVAGIVNNFAIGQQYQCWYNPQNPYVTVLNRSPNLWPMAGGAVFFLAGMAVFFGVIGRMISTGILMAMLLRKSNIQGP
jgi:Protein of unknown function (DUF3592)